MANMARMTFQGRLGQDAVLAQKPHIVIGTPGRVVDLLASHANDFRRLRFLILDEADKLLSNEALRSALDEMLKRLPRSTRQTGLFSATMPESYEDVELLGLKNPAKFQQEQTYSIPVELQ